MERLGVTQLLVLGFEILFFLVWCLMVGCTRTIAV